MMDLIVSWLCSGIAMAFQEAVSFFSGLFGYDVTEFNRTFSFAADAYTVIRNVALALTLIIAAWQIFNFFTKGAESSTTPVKAVINTLVAVGFIFFGNYLLELVLDFCQYPYNALNNINGVEVGFNISWGKVVCSTVSDAFAKYSALLYLIMLLLICFSFIKLLLEIVERYVITFVLLYLSPLAAATLASTSTNGIYKKFITMFFSQCLLLFLNVWCLRMACSGLSLAGYEGDSLIVPFLLCYAFLRVSAKMDSYINQLGLNAAITGNGLGAELFAAGATLLGGGRAGGGGNALGAASGGNKVLGGLNQIQNLSNRYTPAGAVGKFGADGIKGGFGSDAFRSAKGFREKASAWWDGAVQGVKHSDNGISNLFASGARKNLNQQLVDGAQYDRKAKEALDKKLKSGEITNEQHKAELQNIQDPDWEKNLQLWSENEHLAHNGFSYIAEGQTQTNEVKDDNGNVVGEETIPAVVDNSSKVAAIAAGLELGEHSPEAAGFIRTGFEQEDGAMEPIAYSLDKSGMRAQYDKDGYRHKMTVHNEDQFRSLARPDREGFQKHTTSKGHIYYVRTSKTKIDPPTSKKEKD